MLIIESQNGERIRKVSDIRFQEDKREGVKEFHGLIKGDGFLLGQYTDKREFDLVKALINEKIATVRFLEYCVMPFGPEALNSDSGLDLVDMFIFKMPEEGFIKQATKQINKGENENVN